MLAISLSFLCVKCKSNSIKDQEIITHTKTNNDSLTKVKYRLYKNQITGIYYFKFRHLPIEGVAEDRFVPVLDNMGDTIKDINEEVFKKVFNFYVDDSYMFEIVENYEQYEVHLQLIDSIPKGCYYENSNYRISNSGSVEYYQGRDISKCGRSVNSIINISSDTIGLRVLDVQGYDCCVLNNIVFIDGCMMRDLDSKNKALSNEIKEAMEGYRFKYQYCYLDN
jgi:hypothetical protein